MLSFSTIRWHLPETGMANKLLTAIGLILSGSIYSISASECESHSPSAGNLQLPPAEGSSSPRDTSHDSPGAIGDNNSHPHHSVTASIQGQQRMPEGSSPRGTTHGSYYASADTDEGSFFRSTSQSSHYAGHSNPQDQSVGMMHEQQMMHQGCFLQNTCYGSHHAGHYDPHLQSAGMMQGQHIVPQGFFLQASDNMELQFIHGYSQQDQVKQHPSQQYYLTTMPAAQMQYDPRYVNTLRYQQQAGYYNPDGSPRFQRSSFFATTCNGYAYASHHSYHQSGLSEQNLHGFDLPQAQNVNRNEARHAVENQLALNSGDDSSSSASSSAAPPPLQTGLQPTTPLPAIEVQPVQGGDDGIWLSVALANVDTNPLRPNVKYLSLSNFHNRQGEVMKPFKDAWRKLLIYLAERRDARVPEFFVEILSAAVKSDVFHDLRMLRYLSQGVLRSTLMAPENLLERLFPSVDLGPVHYGIWHPRSPNSDEQQTNKVQADGKSSDDERVSGSKWQSSAPTGSSVSFSAPTDNQPSKRGRQLMMFIAPIMTALLALPLIAVCAAFAIALILILLLAYIIYLSIALACGCGDDVLRFNSAAREGLFSCYNAMTAGKVEAKLPQQTERTESVASIGDHSSGGGDDRHSKTGAFSPSKVQAFVNTANESELVKKKGLHKDKMMPEKFGKKSEDTVNFTSSCNQEVDMREMIHSSSKHEVSNDDDDSVITEAEYAL